jgi:DNA replication protein DnaC
VRRVCPSAPFQEQGCHAGGFCPANNWANDPAGGGFRTCQLVQKLLTAKKALKLETLLKKLDRDAVVCLDDIGYVEQDREEMDVLFTFLAERYERRSVMITSNLVFSKWDQIFKDPMTTLAAIDRLVHHATILEFDGESVRTQKAKSRSEG